MQETEIPLGQSANGATHRRIREDCHARLRFTHVITLGLLGALGLWGPQSARAAELTIFLNQATESGVRELAAAFEKATGNKVDVSFQGGAALNQKIVSGAGDLASLGLGQFDEFTSSREKWSPAASSRICPRRQRRRHQGRRAEA